MAFLRITKSPNGHSMEEVYSGLQKATRRGLVSESLYFARELGKKYPHLLKKRLCMCVLEDSSCIPLALSIFSAENNLKSLEKFVVVFALLPKTHASAWLNRYSIDKLIIDKFISSDTISTLINNNLEIEAAKRGMVWRAKNKFEKILEEIKEVCERIREGCYSKIVEMFKFVNQSHLLWLAVIYWTTRPEIKKCWEQRASDEEIAKILQDSEVPEKINELPEWVYDKHTRIGKSMGRKYAHFFESSLKFESRVFEKDPCEDEAKESYLKDEQKSGKILKNINLKAIKVRNADSLAENFETCEEDSQNTREIGSKIKKNKAEPPKKIRKTQEKSENPAIESEFKDFLQAQLITRKNAPKVFFCTEISSNLSYVLKGPMQSQLKNYLVSQSLKEIFGLPHTNLREKNFSSSLSGPSAGPYLIAKFVGDSDAYVPDLFEVKSSKLEENSKISKNKIPHWDDSQLENKNLASKLMIALAFRKCIGTNDTCSRNFIIHKNSEIVSIDDPALFQKETSAEISFMWKKELSQGKKNSYAKALKENWLEVKNEIENWKNIITSLNETQKNKLSENGFTESNQIFFISQACFLMIKPENWRW